MACQGIVYRFSSQLIEALLGSRHTQIREEISSPPVGSGPAPASGTRGTKAASRGAVPIKSRLLIFPPMHRQGDRSGIISKRPITITGVGSDYRSLSSSTSGSSSLSELSSSISSSSIRTSSSTSASSSPAYISSSSSLSSSTKPKSSSLL